MTNFVRLGSIGLLGAALLAPWACTGATATPDSGDAGGEGGEGGAPGPGPDGSSGGRTSAGGSRAGGSGPGGASPGGAPASGGNEEPGLPPDPYQFDTDETVLPDTFVGAAPECAQLVPLETLDIHLFSTDGHEFYFEVSPEAAQAGDDQVCARNDPPADLCPNSAINVRVRPFGSDTCADTGKVQLDLRGGETFRTWLEIPTFKLDVGEFTSQKFAQGDSQLRLNNGQGGATVLREAVALRIFRALGYTTPSSSFVRTRSNVWDTVVGPDTWAAHVLVQPYKKEFFEDKLPEAVHVWEGKGDPFSRAKATDGWTSVGCQWSAEGECDKDALQSVVDAVRAVPKGPGFMAATAPVVDWSSIHRYQCLSTLVDAEDDWLHSGNNVVLVLLQDGRVTYLPYSTDATGGLLASIGRPTPFEGNAYLALQCAADPECQAAAINTCHALTDQFEILDVPNSIVGERCDALTAAELERSGDSEACEQMREFYAETPDRVRALLQKAEASIAP